MTEVIVIAEGVNDTAVCLEGPILLVELTFSGLIVVGCNVSLVVLSSVVLKLPAEAVEDVEELLMLGVNVVTSEVSLPLTVVLLPLAVTFKVALTLIVVVDAKDDNDNVDEALLAVTMV